MLLCIRFQQDKSTRVVLISDLVLLCLFFFFCSCAIKWQSELKDIFPSKKHHLKVAIGSNPVHPVHFLVGKSLLVKASHGLSFGEGFIPLFIYLIRQTSVQNQVNSS